MMSIKQIVKAMYADGFKPKNISECLVAGGIEASMIMGAFFIGYALAHYYDPAMTLENTPFYYFVGVAVMRFVRYFFLLWQAR